MAYAIIKSGGKQIKVEAGSQIWVEKLNVEEGKTFEFDHVLAVSNGTKIEIGRPTLDAKVIAKIEKQGKGKKIKILRTKAKSNWKREVGHRQPYTRLLIEEIILNGTSIAKADMKKVKAAKAEAAKPEVKVEPVKAEPTKVTETKKVEVKTEVKPTKAKKAEVKPTEVKESKPKKVEPKNEETKTEE